MSRTLALAQRTIRLAGPAQVALGLLFWTDRARGLLPLHMALGVLFVLALWTFGVAAWRAGAAPGRALLVVASGAVVLAFGILHPRLLPGPRHWLVQLAHLLVGLAAMALARAAAPARSVARHDARADAPQAVPS